IQERIRSEGRLAPWLEQHGLAGLRPLWQRLTIEAGWETAIEAVLRERLQSLEVSQLERITGLLQEQPPGRMSFHSLIPASGPMDPALAPQGLQPLRDRVSSADAAVDHVLSDWLHGIWCVDDVAQALARRPALRPGDRFVVPQGHLISSATVVVHAPDNEQDGVLSRQKELTNLERESRALELMVDEARATAVRIEAEIGSARAALATTRENLSAAMREASAARIHAGRLEQKVDQALADRERLRNDLTQVETRITERRSSLDELAAQFEALDEALAVAQDAEEAARDEVEQVQSALDAARDQQRDAERAEREADFALRTLNDRQSLLSAQALQAGAQL
ncbi:MAG: chromosome segregation protein SMC, partial [Burkholderiales bacterium]